MRRRRRRTGRSRSASSCYASAVRMDGAEAGGEAGAGGAPVYVGRHRVPLQVPPPSACERLRHSQPGPGGELKVNSCLEKQTS